LSGRPPIIRARSTIRAKPAATADAHDAAIRAEERERFVKLLCHGCAEGWPFSGDGEGWHQRPDIEGDAQRRQLLWVCSAWQYRNHAANDYNPRAEERQAHAALRTAAQALVERLDVWLLGYASDGPTWAAELRALREALGNPTATPPADAAAVVID